MNFWSWTDGTEYDFVLVAILVILLIVSGQSCKGREENDRNGSVLLNNAEEICGSNFQKDSKAEYVTRVSRFKVKLQ